jgi:hypothetical protein
MRVVSVCVLGLTEREDGSSVSGSVYDFEVANKYKRELDDTTFGGPDKAREWLYEKVYSFSLMTMINLIRFTFVPFDRPD